MWIFIVIIIVVVLVIAGVIFFITRSGSSDAPKTAKIAPEKMSEQEKADYAKCLALKYYFQPDGEAILAIDANGMEKEAKDKGGDSLYKLANDQAVQIPEDRRKIIPDTPKDDDELNASKKRFELEYYNKYINKCK